MNTNLKKHLSVVVSLALIGAALLRFGISVQASAPPASSLDKNNKERHVAATELSDQAIAYYTGQNTYASLITLAGVDTDDSTLAIGSPLFNKLQNLMRLKDTIGYTSLNDYWEYTDSGYGSSHAMLFYSDEPAPTASAYNREHVWPKSRGNFNESGAGSDLHHLRPTNSQINSDRSSYTMGNVRSKNGQNMSVKSYNGKPVLWLITNYSGNDCNGLVEVADDVKGDVARILLYVYVTYGSSNANKNLFTKCGSYGSGSNDGCKVIESLDTLLEWNAMDPVDEWEMRRNDLAEDVQGNRNVFIDYPELAWYLFEREDEMPDMQTPTHTPSSGSQGEDTPVRLTFYANGTVFSYENGFAGKTMDLPEEAPAYYGWTFEGWVNAPLNETTSEPSQVYTGSYKPSADASFHALYTRTVPGTGTGKWTRLAKTSDLKTGLNIVFTSENNNVVAGALDGKVLRSVACNTFSNGVINTFPADACVFTVGGSSGSWTFSTEDGNLTCSSVKVLNIGGAGIDTWNVAISGGTATVTNTSSYGSLQYNTGAPRFTTYTSTQASIEIYAMNGTADTVYYTTAPKALDHTHQYEDGICTLCGEVLFMDLNKDNTVDEEDVVYLMYACAFPDLYPLDRDADYTHDGKEDLDDAIMILYYVYFPSLNELEI
ncbi:MAG: endonuclease [Lachnospiraceae bacterium]|nr:endonuclease [Lachnospiraceae bacterium]